MKFYLQKTNGKGFVMPIVLRPAMLAIRTIRALAVKSRSAMPKFFNLDVAFLIRILRYLDRTKTIIYIITIKIFDNTRRTNHENRGYL